MIGTRSGDDVLGDGFERVHSDCTIMSLQDPEDANLPEDSTRGEVEMVVTDLEQDCDAICRQMFLGIG